MDRDVIFNKVQTIERCINRINEVYDGNDENLNDYTKQDSIILNIQRSCEACIDLAMHIVSEKKLGIPQNSRDAFEVLHSNNIIDKSTMNKLKAMTKYFNTLAIAFLTYYFTSSGVNNNYYFQAALESFNSFLNVESLVSLFITTHSTPTISAQSTNCSSST